MIDIIQRDRGRPARGRRGPHRRRRGRARSACGATYDAPIEDVWDALTDPERIGRWFLPISGDYRLGGRYQFEGNAGGEIVACERPHRLRVTWVYGEAASPADVSEVELRLSPSTPSSTTLRARAHRDRARRDVGPVRAGRRRRRLGRRAARTGAPPRRRRSVGRSDRLAVVATRDAISTRGAAQAWGAANRGGRRGSGGRGARWSRTRPSSTRRIRRRRPEGHPGRQGRWWRWGRVELPVQNPSSETTTSVSDGLSSTARTGIGTLPGGPVTCP